MGSDSGGFWSALGKTRQSFGKRLAGVLGKLRPGGLDPELEAELEEALILADVGAGAASFIIEQLKRDRSRTRSSEEALSLLREIVADLLTADPSLNVEPGRLSVVLDVGVNGTGKTTTAGKLAYMFRRRGHRVMLGAADTFRAAGIEQISLWARRAGAEVVAHREGADPAAVTFDCLKAAQARGCNVAIIDTAGRLHTRTNLMEELKKVARVASKAVAGAPHEVLLVVDATTGQNAVQQARMFKDAVGVTGLVLTKIDGTARGGVAVAIVKETGIPVKLVGTGEGLEDLAEFDPAAFAAALVDVGAP